MANIPVCMKHHKLKDKYGGCEDCGKWNAEHGWIYGLFFFIAIFAGLFILIYFGR